MATRGKPLFDFDRRLVKNLGQDRGSCLVGMDEVGRGPWAGPVVAAAVALPPDFFDPRLDDSKKLTPRQREILFHQLTRQARWCAGAGSVTVIDSHNILQATRRAMRGALQGLLRKYPDLKPGLVAVDGRPLPDLPFPQKAVIGGDAKSASIAAASVVAKVLRDRLMSALDRHYPQYGFARHKGYGTAVHRESLAKFGPSPLHRKSFAPVRACLEADAEVAP